MGRKPLMILSGVAFAISIPIIALSQGFGPLFFGRLLQGISGGFIGIVVPLYLAECLGASNRGKGTAIFQWLLTLGIVAAALVGIYYSYRVQSVAAASDAATLFAFKNEAWRRIFWVSLPPAFSSSSAALPSLNRRAGSSCAAAATRPCRTPPLANCPASRARAQ